VPHGRILVPAVTSRSHAEAAGSVEPPGVAQQGGGWRKKYCTATTMVTTTRTWRGGERARGRRGAPEERVDESHFGPLPRQRRSQPRRAKPARPARPPAQLGKRQPAELHLRGSARGGGSDGAGGSGPHDGETTARGTTVHARNQGAILIQAYFVYRHFSYSGHVRTVGARLRVEPQVSR
jgi:hypothetical protein